MRFRHQQQKETWEGEVYRNLFYSASTKIDGSRVVISFSHVDGADTDGHWTVALSVGATRKVKKAVRVGDLPTQGKITGRGTGLKGLRWAADMIDQFQLQFPSYAVVVEPSDKRRDAAYRALLRRGFVEAVYDGTPVLCRDADAFYDYKTKKGLRKMRRNPLQSYTVPPRPALRQFDPAQRYLGSRVAKDKFTRFFKKWPLPVALYLPADGVNARSGAVWEEARDRNRDGVTFIIDQTPFDPMRPPRWDEYRESIWTPFTLMHRTADEMSEMFDPHQTGGLGILPPTPELAELARVNAQMRQIQRGLMRKLRKNRDPFRRKLYQATKIALNAIGVSTAAGREALMKDDGPSDVFAAWSLYKKWTYQMGGSLSLTPAQWDVYLSSFSKGRQAEARASLEDILSDPITRQARKDYGKLLKRRCILLDHYLRETEGLVLSV